MLIWSFDMRRLIFLTFIFFLISTHAWAVTVYVNPFTSPSAGHAGTIGDPYQTWTEPCAALNGVGGTILINPGSTYIQSAGPALYTNNCSGVSGNKIIFQGNVSIPTNTPGANAGAPVIENTNTSGCGSPHDCGFAGRTIQINAQTHDVEFQNLIITGFNVNTSCIQYETGAGSGFINYRITYDHLTMSNCGCDSLYGQGGDYYTITNNVVTNSGSTCSSASVSGIHIYQPINLDTNAGTHILISANEVSGESKGCTGVNTPTGCYGAGAQSDGNGIQVPDDANGTQGGWCAAIDATRPGACPYTGLVQIQNNLIYNNDGSGFSYFSSSNPENVVNNTFYQNVANQSSGSVWGEIIWNISSAYTVGTLQSYNNIAYSRGAAYRCHLIEGTGSSYTVTANANDNFSCTTAFTAGGSGSFSTGAANVTGNPNFTSPTTDFSLASPSPCIGTANGAFAPSTNLFNNSRTGSGGVCTAVSKPNMGAI